jgi:hypothetical protein
VTEPVSALRTFVQSLLILLALPAVAAAATPIVAARDLPLGTTVTIEGRVTVPSGLFASASLQDKGFAIQDVTGGIAASIAERHGSTVPRDVPAAVARSRLCFLRASPF